MLLDLPQLIHEEIALQLVVSNGDMKEKTFTHAWFFFDIMVSIMCSLMTTFIPPDTPQKKKKKKKRNTAHLCHVINFSTHL